MDRRRFLLGAGAASLAACTAPERDLLAPYEGVEIPLEPGSVEDGSTPTLESGTPADGAGDDGSVPPTDPETGLPVDVPVEDLPGLSFVARAIVPTVVVDEVLGSGDARWSFANPIDSGGDLVFLIDEFDRLDHFRVLLPTRPNGSYGWIKSSDVTIDRHNFKIIVELASFQLTVLHRDEDIFTTTVGVARENAPTPQGRYYLTELISPTAPDSLYGAYAYGLSGYSDTFTSFNGGDGQLGIHGTNDPETLGTNVSSGCIRMHNDDITRVVEEIRVPTGAPVEVI